MYFLKSPINRWLFVSLFSIILVSCEMDSQLSTLANVSTSESEQELQNLNDSSHLRTGNIIYEETFEGSNPLSKHIHRQLAGSHSFNVVSSPVLEGRRSGRFELRKGDPVVTSSGIRAEMLFQMSLLDQLGRNGWYSYGVYFPSDGFTPDDDEELITQWQNVGGSPFLSLRIVNDRLKFRIEKEYIDLGPIIRDVWYQYVFRIIQSTGSGGRVEVWQNGEKVVSHAGKNSHSSEPYKWKIGVYKSNWEHRQTNTSKRVIYFDNVKIGNKNATYEEMIPSADKLSEPSKQLKGPIELNKGLVAHWNMDEKGGNRLVDHSGRNNNASIVDPSGVSWINGKVGSALRMRKGGGRNFSNVPHNSSLNLTEAVTIAGWIRPTTKANKTIVAKTPNGYELGTVQNGKIEFRINRESDGATYRLQSNKDYPTDGDTWIHVVATFDGQSSILYINGVRDYSAGYGPTKIRTNTRPLVIGARDTGNRWEGDLDDLRIYNRAINSAEANALFTGNTASNGGGTSDTQSSNPTAPAPAPAPSPSAPQNISNGLVGFWKMDEGSGRTLVDHSGNRNNATIVDVSGVSWVRGKDGSALRMDSPTGRYYSTVPHNSTLNITSAITVSAWIKPTIDNANRIVLSKSPNGFELGIVDNGKVEFRINRNADGSRYRLRSNKNHPSDGTTWMHVAATFDGNKSTIYINGIADNSATYGKTQIISNNSPLVIGARGSGNRWEGDLDNVMVFNRALSASEIANLAR